MSRVIKFRLRRGSKIAGYEKWYSGVGLRAKAQWLYSTDGEYWNPEYIEHDGKDQFTGLLDKNSVEIYEGDICQLRGEYQLPQYWRTTEAIWSDINHCWLFRGYYGSKTESEHYGVRFPEAMTGEIEIIGTIHENPELLEQAP